MEASASLDAGELIFLGNFAGLDEVVTVHAVLFVFFLAVGSVLSDSVDRVVSEAMLWQHSLDVPDVPPANIYLADHLAAVVLVRTELH